VKPAQSAGSDDVFLCNSLVEAETAFHKIFNSINGLGLQNTSVLVQEYLLGVEYVIDKVSLNGEHKVVAVWQYDKRPINGASFVYFGVRLMSSTTKMAQVMCEYADTVLTALNILNGPSHMEIMLHTTVDPITGKLLFQSSVSGY
jgi:biotin carboxylase